MDSAVISDRMSELLKGREVVAAIFTTYTFEPEFFELEVIPLLLSNNTAYSMDERVKQFMVRENLRESGVPIEVFYDLPMYRKNGNCSPQMEYLCHGVNLGNSAFHGKINILLVKDNNDNESILLSAGSNNLSRAGWWDNIECQHWVEINSGDFSRKSLKFLREDIGFLEENRSLSSKSSRTAFYKIKGFISDLKGGQKALDLNYYGLSYNNKGRNFINFLKERNGPLTKYGNWNLEIISPFFADDAENIQHKVFFDLGVKEIKLLLPMDEEGNALCDKDYFGHINKEEGITWAEWENKTSADLVVKGCYRRLHAKIYHFYNKVQSWVFVGSVNFTYKALHENAEAGFLTKLDSISPLLKSIPEDKDIECFMPPEDLIPGADDKNIDDKLTPEIHLCFDWKSKKLTGWVNKKRTCYEIEIIGAEGTPIIKPWLIEYKEGTFEGDSENLEKLLENGSLVKVRGKNNKDKNKTRFPEHQILLQQIGWSHKPLGLPELSASQILAIYAGMSLERRQMMLMNEKIRDLVINSKGGELTSNIDDQIVEQFFSEYAEIFNAFSKLKEILDRRLVDGNDEQVDYYLTGTGVDSLKTLVQRALEDQKEIKNNLNSVARYLILLSAKEVYEFYQHENVSNIDIELKSLAAAIDSLKNSDSLKLEDNSKQNRQTFFKWFEEEFFRVYKAKEKES